MKLGVFDSAEPCETCGGHQLLFSPRHNAHLEQDLITLFERPLRPWNILAKRRQQRFAEDVRGICADLREKTLHA